MAIINRAPVLAKEIIRMTPVAEKLLSVANRNDNPTIAKQANRAIRSTPIQEAVER